MRHTEFPILDALGSSIVGSQTAGNDSSVGLSDLNQFGGTLNFGVANAWDNQTVAFFLNRNSPQAEMSYTQPLLAGFGRDANLAPIVIARLQQEQSYFQFKDSMQELVRGTISAYWSLVQARTELWAREIQVDSRVVPTNGWKCGFARNWPIRGRSRQSRLAYANFRANLITARAMCFSAKRPLET